MFNAVDTEEMVSVTVKMRPNLLAAIEQAVKVNGEGRGQFIRNSIKASLEKRNVPVKPDSHLAPDRAGVGGKPTHKAHRGAEASVIEVSSTAGLTPGGSLAEIEAQAEALAHRRSLEARAPIVRIGPPSGGKRRPAAGVPPGKGGPP